VKRRESAERPSRARWLTTAIVGLLCAAPVPGDIGSCGQPVQRLDPVTFFGAKKNIDCERCRSCGLRAASCSIACGDVAPDAAFPRGCEPLVHDGEVCLRRLLEASCDEYFRFVAEPPTMPTECDFCPR